MPQHDGTSRQGFKLKLPWQLGEFEGTGYQAIFIMIAVLCILVLVVSVLTAATLRSGISALEAQEKLRNIALEKVVTARELQMKMDSIEHQQIVESIEALIWVTSNPEKAKGLQLELPNKLRQLQQEGQLERNQRRLRGD